MKEILGERERERVGLAITITTMGETKVYVRCLAVSAVEATIWEVIASRKTDFSQNRNLMLTSS